MFYLLSTLVKKIKPDHQGDSGIEIGSVHKIAIVNVLLIIAITIWIMTSLPGDILKKYGYLKIVPPSTLHGPGTFNTIEYRGYSSVQLHPTCEIDYKALTGFIKESDTVDSDITEYISNKVREKLISTVESSLSAKHVKKAHLTLRNVKILALTDQALVELRNKYINGPCEEAITINLKNGSKVCQAKAVLQGNMVYTVSYDSSVDAAQQEKLTDGIASSLGFSAKRQGSNEVTGEGLYYGVKLSEHCIELPNRGHNLVAKISF